MATAIKIPLDEAVSYTAASGESEDLAQLGVRLHEINIKSV